MERNLILKSIFIAVCLISLPVIMEGKTNIKGNGKVVTREIPVENFDKIAISGEVAGSNGWYYFNKKKAPQLIYQQTSGPAKVEITTDENLFSILNIRQEGTKLLINFSGRDTVVSPTQFRIAGASATLKGVNVNSYANIYIDTPLKTDSIHINIEGVGNTEIKDITCNYIFYECNGVGNLFLKGETENAKYHVNGVGKVDAVDCRAENATCGLSGVGNIKLYVAKKLQAHLSGVGSIKYAGSPSTENSHNSGVGRIRRLK